MSTHQTIVVLTDRYWPAKGGAEEAARSVAAVLSGMCQVRVVSHEVKAGGRSLLHRTALLPGFGQFTDPSGIAVQPLTPSLAGRLWLLPMALWYAPLVRKLAARHVFDFLFRFYRAAFRRKLERLCVGASAVHCLSTGHLAILTQQVCGRLNIPLIQNPYVHFGRWGDTPRLLAAYAGADVLICPTQHFERRRGEMTPGQHASVVVIPPLPPGRPETTTRPAGMASTGRFALFLGRREQHKGLHLLVEAFAKLSTGAHLVVAGPGPALDPCPTFCVDIGEVSDEEKHWLLASCSLFCLPSHDESFGLSYVEAMSYGRPVVAVDVAPVNEIVVNGVTGLLTPPGEPGALATALESILSSDDLARAMGAAAAQRYHALYSRERLAEKLLELYANILPAPQARH